MSIKHPCACGCGQTAFSLKTTGPAYKQGHAPVRSYRYVGRSNRLHRLRAERALGKPLPAKAEVHHADGSRSETAGLVICQDRAYHMLLHARMRVQAAGGDPNTDRICVYCRKIKNIKAMTPPPKGRPWRCRECRWRRRAE